MSNSKEKVSFSFSKVKKPVLSNRKANEPKEEIEYVDAFDGTNRSFSYKGNIRQDVTSNQELIIPLITSESIITRIENKEKSRSSKINDSRPTSKINSNENSELKNTSVTDEKNLLKLAEAEILNDIKKTNTNVEKTSDSLVIKHNSSEAESENSVIDYEKIPVGDFGMAMLRGMGWKPDYGIGKNPRLVLPVSPKLRPKGLGLGAKLNNEEGCGKKS